MRNILGAAILAACLILLAGPALAQDTNFIFGEYYVCDQSREAFADELVEHVLGPIYQRHVDSGELSGWGWMGHHAGGRWRRLLFYTSNDLDKLLATRDKIIEESQAAEVDEAGRAFVRICGGHDDLIWSTVAGSSTTDLLANLGPVSYSTYYVCDTSRQERADEIVKQIFEPAINDLVKSGQISGWGWHAHVIGGRFRRLMTHSGMSHAALIDAVNKYNEAAGEANQALADEFGQICGSHQDYLWNTIIPKPEGN